MVLLGFLICVYLMLSVYHYAEHDDSGEHEANVIFNAVVLIVIGLCTGIGYYNEKGKMFDQLDVHDIRQTALFNKSSTTNNRIDKLETEYAALLVYVKNAHGIKPNTVETTDVETKEVIVVADEAPIETIKGADLPVGKFYVEFLVDKVSRCYYAFRDSGVQTRCSLSIGDGPESKKKLVAKGKHSIESGTPVYALCQDSSSELNETNIAFTCSDNVSLALPDKY